MTSDKEKEQQVQHAIELIDQLAADPSASFIIPILERVKRRLEDRGMISSSMAGYFHGDNLANHIRETYAAHGSLVANEDMPTSSDSFNHAIAELSSALQPLTEAIEPENTLLTKPLFSNIIMGIVRSNGGPLSQALLTDNPEALAKEHDEHEAKTLAYFQELGIKIDSPPKGTAQLIPELEKSISELEQFKETLHNEEFKSDLTHLISCYRKIIGIVRTPETVTPLIRPKKFSDTPHLDSLRAIDTEMKTPFLKLYSEYFDVPKFTESLLSVHTLTLDLITDFLIEKKQENSPKNAIRGDSHNTERVSPKSGREPD